MPAYSCVQLNAQVRCECGKETATACKECSAPVCFICRKKKRPHSRRPAYQLLGSRRVGGAGAARRFVKVTAVTCVMLGTAECALGYALARLCCRVGATWVLMLGAAAGDSATDDTRAALPLPYQ